MPESITYSCTSLAGTNKAGKLHPDNNGYYEVVLGAFDFKNSAGDIYPFKSAKHLFDSSSSLMRRIRNGQCRGELGHPRRESGMSYNDYVQRILEIHEDKVSHHIKSVRIDTESIQQGNNGTIVAVIGKVKPAGPFGNQLKESMKNPDENVAFSVRSLVEPVCVEGVVHKNMKVLVTWDNVLQPGISIANKYSSPALETILEDIHITESAIDSLDANDNCVGIETSGISVETLKTELGWSKIQVVHLPSLKW